MKVKCVRLLNSAGNEVEFSPWLTLGKVYHVLNIDIELNRGISYRILCHDNKPNSAFTSLGYHASACFEVVSDVVPSNWRVKIYKEASISIAPETWQTPGFWEAFYEADPEAYTSYQHEFETIQSEDP